MRAWSWGPGVAERRVLLTGATGIVGREVLARLRATGDAVVATSRRGDPAAGVVAWDMSDGPAPVAGPFDVVVHAAASTRWTMTDDGARRANVVPTERALALLAPGGHFVHVSTAFAEGLAGTGVDGGRDDYRNAYEWSKAAAERLLREAAGPHSVVRPPLIIGRAADGVIARWSGTYSLLTGLTSGLVAAVVGDPDVYVELAPADAVADAIAARAAAGPPAETVVDVLGAGAGALTIGRLIDEACTVLNGFRAERGVAALEQPPFVSHDSWHRFFLPFGRDHFSHYQLRAIELLSEFQAYTTTTAPITPTCLLTGVPDAFRRSVEYWAARNERTALRVPQAWAGPPATPAAATTGGRNGDR